MFTHYLHCVLFTTRSCYQAYKLQIQVLYMSLISSACYCLCVTACSNSSSQMGKDATLTLAHLCDCQPQQQCTMTALDTMIHNACSDKQDVLHSCEEAKELVREINKYKKCVCVNAITTRHYRGSQTQCIPVKRPMGTKMMRTMRGSTMISLMSRSSHVRHKTDQFT